VDTSFAQTNIQLYNDLAQVGYCAEDIREVAGAYGLACEIFVGKYRGSGKPLLAHLVGTAAIVAQSRPPVSAVVTALLHAAHEDGDFGRRSPRETLIANVGEEAATYIESYHNMKWTYDESAVRVMLRDLHGYGTAEREAIRVRIANEVEDYLDLAPHYHGKVVGSEVKGAEWRLQYMDRIQPTLIELATRLGDQQLAETAKAVFSQVRDVTIDPQLRSGRPYMWFQAPPSYRRRIDAVARDLIRESRRLARQGPRVLAAKAARRLVRSHVKSAP
jgi:hypothetical protein